jgi:CheY-specific phosphatase CheX
LIGNSGEKGMETIDDILNTTIPAATQSVLTTHGVNVIGNSNQAALYSVVAVIGFSGDDFGGALGFAAEGEFVKGAYGEQNTNLSDSWVGEIANQLVGRLKSALLSYGVEIRLAIPMVLHGLDIKVRQSETQITQYRCRSEQGGACVWVDANWDIHQKVRLASAEEQPQAEGELMLF